MKRIFKIIVILVTIILALGLSISSFILPQVKGQNVSKEEFSAERAMQYVEKIAVTPHPIGSKEHDNVRDYLINELKNLGLEPEIQKDLSTNEIWGEFVQGNIENIYCRLKGTGDSKEAILMSAHYDSTSGGPGAADDASGVATILETIRALKSGEPLRNDVIFLISDGEEKGLLGAKSFVDNNELFKDVAMVINFEARGNSGPVIMFETGDNNNWFMKEFKKSVLEPVAYSFLYEIYKLMPNNTDFTVLKTGGKEGFNFASIMGYETYHNSNDNAENLNQRTLQHNGNYALSLVKHFGNLSLNNLESGGSVYFTIAKSVFVEYSSSLAVPFSIFGLILFIATFIYGFKNEILSFKNTFIGFLLTLSLIIISTIVGSIVAKVYSLYANMRYGKLSHNISAAMVMDERIFISIFAVLTSCFILILCRVVHKKISYENMIYGNMLLMIILTLGSSLKFKSASYMFLWPTIFTLAGLGIKFIFKGKQDTEYNKLFLIIFSIMSFVLIYVPIVFLIFIALGLPAASIILGIAVIPLSNIILSSLLFYKKESTRRIYKSQICNSYLK
jgi:hypothetical protein